MKVTPFNWKHASEVYIYSAYNLHRIQIYINIEVTPFPFPSRRC